MDYKIVKINSDGTVNVAFTSSTYSIPGNRASHSLADVPLDSSESTTAYLDEYARSFAQGLELEKDQSTQTTGLPTEVAALVNKVKTVNLAPIEQTA